MQYYSTKISNSVFNKSVCENRYKNSSVVELTSNEIQHVSGRGVTLSIATLAVLIPILYKLGAREGFFAGLGVTSIAFGLTALITRDSIEKAVLTMIEKPLQLCFCALFAIPIIRAFDIIPDTNPKLFTQS